MTLPDPKGKQKEVLYLPAIGHTVVLGTAGSGKTTLAILRSCYLANPASSNSGRVLLVTFNCALVAYLQSLKGDLGNVQVENYHKFARGYLNAKGKMSYNCILDPSDRDSSIMRAILSVKASGVTGTFLDRSHKFFSAEIAWISGHEIADLTAYINVERIGQTSRIRKENRPVMWQVYLAYLEDRRRLGKRYDWDDLACAVRAAASGDTAAKRYKHVVIDEGQDFSPAMLRSLANIIPVDGSLTFFGDVAQQIYGQRMSWRQAGLNPTGGKTWNFKHNYRNTAEIAALALAISKMPFFPGDPDIVAPEPKDVRGPKPVLIRCASQEREIQHVCRIAMANASTKSVAILVKTREMESLFTSNIGRDAIRLHKDMSTWVAGPGIRYGTFHSAKGLEFDMVIIPCINGDLFPDAESCTIYGADEASAHDGKMLYVAVTRAKTDLIISYSGTISPLIPSDNGLFQREHLA